MRQYKFRGYNKNDGIMLDPVDIKDMVVLNAGTGFSDDLILMQWTGLHDRNGKEVYEGDIIRNHEGDVAEVKYVIEHAAYMARLVNPHQYHYITTDGKLKICEVIGNVWENPDLLEG